MNRYRVIITVTHYRWMGPPGGRLLQEREGFTDFEAHDDAMAIRAAMVIVEGFPYHTRPYERMTKVEVFRIVTGDNYKSIMDIEPMTPDPRRPQRNKNHQGDHSNEHCRHDFPSQRRKN
jgi:hypothetical protein